MKRPHVRHVHARPDEHIQVHRTPSSSGGLFAILGPVGGVIAGLGAIYLVYKLVTVVFPILMFGFGMLILLRVVLAILKD